MDTKTTKLADNVLALSHRIIQNPADWEAFLDTACKNYKYCFYEQMLIHHQRPGATACADYKTWNDKFGRYIKKGTKAIVLFSLDDEAKRKKYVYDISDTFAARKNAVKPFIWTVTDENESFLKDALTAQYGKSGEIMEQLIHMVNEVVDENAFYIANQLLYTDAIKDTERRYLDESSSKVLKDNLAYMILTRCGIDASDLITGDTMDNIRELAGNAGIGGLGGALSELSEYILRDIEKTVKEYERSKENGYSAVRLRTGSGYGNMRRKFLKEEHKWHYQAMMAKETLLPHLEEVEIEARERVESLIQAFLEKNPAPEKRPIRWAGWGI